MVPAGLRPASHQTSRGSGPTWGGLPPPPETQGLLEDQVRAHVPLYVLAELEEALRAGERRIELEPLDGLEGRARLLGEEIEELPQGGASPVLVGEEVVEPGPDIGAGMKSRLESGAERLPHLGGKRHLLGGDPREED